MDEERSKVVRSSQTVDVHCRNSSTRKQMVSTRATASTLRRGLTERSKAENTHSRALVAFASLGMPPSLRGRPRALYCLTIEASTGQNYTTYNSQEGRPTDSAKRLPAGGRVRAEAAKRTQSYPAIPHRAENEYSTDIQLGESGPAQRYHRRSRTTSLKP